MSTDYRQAWHDMEAALERRPYNKPLMPRDVMFLMEGLRQKHTVGMRVDLEFEGSLQFAGLEDWQR